jgi:hypothetical protein
MNPHSPEHAKMVATYAGQVLNELRSQKSITMLNARFESWRTWATANKVCTAIRKHVRDAVTETERDIKADKALRESTEQPTGKMAAAGADQ